MCGICGIFNLNGDPAAPAVLRRMTNAIAHRGPDGEGFYFDSFVGLGHRRLAVIDLTEAGHQPMLSQDGQYALTYNGEIYNFKELRKELEDLGYRFRSRTDSEVVLYAYAAWGPKCVERFNGMFAFVLWDKAHVELFVARDRYGIKPLYYTFCGSSFLFASEQKAILEHPRVSREVDLEALLEYFTFQNLFTDRTLLKGVRLFPAGCWGKVPLGGSGTGRAALKIHRYWDFDFHEPERPALEQEYIEELDRLFQQAVKRQLVSDVELGCYLSGGIDSGSITAVASRELPYIKTFTCGFDLHSASGLELGFDERKKSEQLSYLFRTEHYEVVLKAGDMERALPEVAWHLEEPRVGQSYPNYYIARLSSKFVKVILAGTGGDELFGGYPWRYYKATASSGFEDYIDRHYSYWQRLIPNRILRRVFKPIWKHVEHVWTRDIFRNVFLKCPQQITKPEDYINHSLYFEAKTFLHGLLVVDDKHSMAHGLEARVPFLDNDLVDFAMQVPVRLKLRNLTGLIRLNENEPGAFGSRRNEKARDGKLVLRKVMERYVPPDIARAQKQGFSAPDASWFKGESIEYVRKELMADEGPIYDYLDRETVREIVNDHLTGERNRRLAIWSFLNFQWWLRKFILQSGTKRGDMA